MKVVMSSPKLKAQTTSASTRQDHSSPKARGGAKRKSCANMKLSTKRSRISTRQGQKSSTGRRQASLLDLPPEVRIIIYRYVFEDAGIRYEPQRSLVVASSPDYTWFPFDITCTCRLIREEALPELSAATTLRVTWGCRCCMEGSQYNLIRREGGRLVRGSIPDHYLRHIRNMEADLDYCKFLPLHRLPASRSLTINLGPVWAGAWPNHYKVEELIDATMVNFTRRHIEHQTQIMRLLDRSKFSFKVLLHLAFFWPKIRLKIVSNTSMAPV